MFLFRWMTFFLTKPYLFSTSNILVCLHNNLLFLLMCTKRRKKRKKIIKMNKRIQMRNKTNNL